MTPTSLVKVRVVFALVAALHGESQLSAAFSVYGMNELLALDKRANDMLPVVRPFSSKRERFPDTIQSVPDQVHWLPADGEDDFDLDAGESTSSPSTTMTTRRKRYTEYQDTALSICAGDCMYKRRLAYGDCYDMCNWNGRTSSPWKKLDKLHPEQKPQTYASKVLTHRFGQRKNNAATTTPKPSISAPRGGGRRNRIRIGRPLRQKIVAANRKQSKTNRKTSNRQRSKTAGSRNNGTNRCRK